MSNFWKASIPFEFYVDAPFEECLKLLETYRHSPISAKEYWTEPRRAQVQIGIIGSEFCQVNAIQKEAYIDAQLDSDGDRTLVSGYAEYDGFMFMVMTALVLVFGFILFNTGGFPEGSFLFLPFVAIPWLATLYTRHVLMEQFRGIFTVSKKKR